MMMKYIGQFKDINDVSYSVEITNNSSGGDKVLLLTPSPFLSEIETSDAHLYKPCKYSSATIGIVVKDYLFGLYSSSAQENKVTLKQGNTIKWVGYITPNLYSQGYEKEMEEIELEAIDGLATLQYFKYKPYQQKKNIISFVDMVRHILSQCKCYSNFYISDANQLNSTSNASIIDSLYISEQNFFDEDDEAMTYQEVLEEVCKYLNVTCVAKGDEVYFLDYDGVKNNINTYYKYSITGGAATKVTIHQHKDIQGSDYALNGQQLSLDNVYNKVSVKDSLYSYDSIIPSIWDKRYISYYLHNGEPVQEVKEDGKGGWHHCFFQYLHNKNYKCYYYNKATLQPVAEPLTVNYQTTQTLVGATICKASFNKVSDWDGKFNNISYTDYLLLHVHNTYDGKLRPLFELEVNDSNISFIGGKTYIIIKGNFLFMDRESEMYIMQGYGNKKDNFLPSRLYIDCKLQYGDKYWNGTEWTTTDTTFKLYFDPQGQTDHCINRSFPVKNNIDYRMGIDGNGYAVPMPSSNVIVSKPKFTLYHPHKVDGDYRCDAVWLSGFDIIAKVQNFQNDEEKDTDTMYSNVINDTFVNEMKEEEYKICTWDNKECNYSSVCYKDSTGYNYADTIYNKATKQNLRQEEQFIYRLITQYSTPSTILNLTLKNNYNIYSSFADKHLPNKIFIVDSITEDYVNASQQIKLIEKK